MDNQHTQLNGVSHTHKKLLYVAVGFSALAVILLSVALLKMSNHSVNSQGQTQQTQQSAAVPTQTITQSVNQQTAVTPMPINNAQDVSDALQEVNNTDTSSIRTALNQNTSDATQFSQ